MLSQIHRWFPLLLTAAITLKNLYASGLCLKQVSMILRMSALCESSSRTIIMNLPRPFRRAHSSNCTEVHTRDCPRLRESRKASDSGQQCAIPATYARPFCASSLNLVDVDDLVVVVHVVTEVREGHGGSALVVLPSDQIPAEDEYGGMHTCLG